MIARSGRKTQNWSQMDKDTRKFFSGGRAFERGSGRLSGRTNIVSDGLFAVLQTMNKSNVQVPGPFRT